MRLRVLSRRSLDGILRLTLKRRSRSLSSTSRNEKGMPDLLMEPIYPGSLDDDALIGVAESLHAEKGEDAFDKRLLFGFVLAELKRRDINVHFRHIIAFKKMSTKVDLEGED